MGAETRALGSKMQLPGWRRAGERQRAPAAESEGWKREGPRRLGKRLRGAREASAAGRRVRPALVGAGRPVPWPGPGVAQAGSDLGRSVVAPAARSRVGRNGGCSGLQPAGSGEPLKTAVAQLLRVVCALLGCPECEGLC